MDGWRDIKLLAFDVDGVLTDGTIYYGPGGDAMKGFSARDGMGISLARAAGLKTAIITGRRSPMVERRAEDLHIDYVMQNTSDKLAAFSQLCRDLGISMGEAAYMGDDLNDLAVVAKAGCGASPADGCAEVREAASFVSAYAGGHGALREWVEYILKQQHQWDSVLSRYMSGMAAVIQ